MANQTEIIILDLNNELKKRHQERSTTNFDSEIQRLLEIREKQKTWNFKRGVLIRKYKKKLDNSSTSEAERKIIEREIKGMPKYNLKNIDNEVSRLKKEDYVITLKWKGGDYQILSSDLISQENPAMFVLDIVKESKESMNFGANDENRIKLLKVIDYNLRALDFGNFDTAEKGEYPIFCEFVGDYIIINI